MRNYRATKGWMHMGTNDMSYSNQETKQERVRREKRFDDAIRAIKPSEYVYDEKMGSIDPIGLKKEGDAAAAAKLQRKASLMSAFSEKKLKSKSLIREAQGYNKKKQGNKQVKPA
jgi:hypothetical protein